MISNGWLVGLEAFAVVLFTAIIQRVWPTPDPNAKRLAYLESRVSELSRHLGIEEAPLVIEAKELIAQGRKLTPSSGTVSRQALVFEKRKTL